MRKGLWAAWALLVVIPAGGCAHEEARPDARPTLRAIDYYPLAVGTAWTYRPEPAPAGTPDHRIEVTGQDAEGFFQLTGGGRMAHRRDGVFDGDRFILQDPLKTGHSWMAVPSVSTVEKYEIVDTGFAVTTPAGFFDDCVRVRAETDGRTESGEAVRIELLWTYAPGVGMIRLVQRAAVGNQAPQERARMTLVKFEPAQGAP